MKTTTLIALMILALNSCMMEKPNDKVEQYKEEIIATEKAFAQMVKEKGIKEGFLFYAADSAVIRRGDDIIKGKEAIRDLYSNYSSYKDVSLEWTPDYVDASASGDLGYTYGKYKYSATDSFGKVVQSTGVFHTVWKRQPDGSWKFVWD